MSATAESFYVTGGTLRQDAPSYVERRADKDLYEGLQRGEFCYVLTSRQMGKSSLMVHTAARLRAAEIAVAVLDLTAVGQNLSVEQWYGGLLRRIGRQLDPSGALEEALDDLWFEQQARVGPLERWMGALQRLVLPQVPGRIVLFLDEIDAVRSLPFSTDEFFAAIRECYNRRTQDPAFERLTFCLLGVATPSDLIQDTRTTPFNIGQRIDLTDFSAAEVAPLAGGLAGGESSLFAEKRERAKARKRTEGEGGSLPGQDRAPASVPFVGSRFRSFALLCKERLRARGEASGERHPRELLERVLHWTGGHPYLTQRLCQAVARDESVTDAAGVDQQCEALFLSAEAREKDDNLLFVRERLLKSEADLASLLDLYGKVRAGRRVGVDDTNPLIDLLRLSGIVRLGTAHPFTPSPLHPFAPSAALRVRNRIYERVFDRAWVTQHMPDAELRRQKAAYRRGLVRAAAVSGVVVAVVASLALTAVRQARRADHQRRVADQQRRAADQQRRLAEERERTARMYLYGAQMNVAQQAWETGNLAGALRLLDAERPGPGEQDLRGFEWRYLWRLCQGDAGSTTLAHTGQVSAVAFSPDGQLLASGGTTGIVKLWAEERGDSAREGVGAGNIRAAWRVVASLHAHKGGVSTVAFSPDGRLLASASWDGTVKLWATAARRELATLKVGSGVSALASSPDGQLLATGSADGTVKLWSAAARRERAALQRGAAGPNSAISGVAFSPDGRRLAAGCWDNTVKLWEVASRRRIMTLTEFTSSVNSVAFSPDGKKLITGGWEGVKLWDSGTGRQLATFSGSTGGWVSAVPSPDGKTIASGGSSTTIQLWDAASGRELATLRGHTAAVEGLAFSPDGRALVSASDDQTMRFWDSGRTRAPDTLGDHRQPIHPVAFSPDGRLLAAGSQDGTTRVWGAASQLLVATFKGHTLGVGGVAFSPDGKLLATGSYSWPKPELPGEIKLWDVRRWREVATLTNHRDSMLSLAFSPDGGRLAASGFRNVTLWDLAARRLVATLKGHTSVVTRVAFSRDGKLLVSSGWDGGVKLWDVGKRRELATLAGHVGSVMSAAFSPDGQSLVTSSFDRTAKLWAAASQRLVATFSSPTMMFDAVFSPDGRSLATAELDGSVRLWNIATRQPMIALKGQTGHGWSLAFSPDGNTLASTNEDGTVRLWRAAPFQETDPVRVTATCGEREVRLQWRPVRDAAAYNVYRGPGSASARELRQLNREPVPGGVFVDHSPDLVIGRPQSYAVAPLFPGRAGRMVEGVRVTLPATPVSAPPGFLGSSINEGEQCGSVRFQPATGEITVRGSGHDTWDQADGFYFVNQPVTGDFQITVRALTRPTDTHDFAKAGLMVRDALDAGARRGGLAITAEHGLEFNGRDTTDGPSSASALFPHAALKLPILLRLTRRGNTVTAQVSRDNGRSFQPAGQPMTFDPPLASTVYAGLAITAHDESQVSEAKFSGLRIEALGR